MRRNSAREQHRDMAGIERRWSTLAFLEGRDNLRQSRRNQTLGNLIKANRYHREADADYYWYARRMRIVNYHRRMARLPPLPLRSRQDFLRR